MTKEELRKSLDFVNEERERLQKELERKDNIINELKKIIDYYGTDKEHNDNVILRHILKGMLDKIKEIEND